MFLQTARLYKNAFSGIDVRIIGSFIRCQSGVPGPKTDYGTDSGQVDKKDGAEISLPEEKPRNSLPLLSL